jgi:hypothetical protein
MYGSNSAQSDANDQPLSLPPPPIHPQPAQEAFTAPSLSHIPSVDPLSQTLHHVNSAQRPQFGPQTLSTNAFVRTPVPALAPIQQETFLLPIQQHQHQQALPPSLMTPVQMQLLDNLGRSLQTGNTAFFKKHTVDTWALMLSGNMAHLTIFSLHNFLATWVILFTECLQQHATQFPRPGISIRPISACHSMSIFFDPMHLVMMQSTLWKA